MKKLDLILLALATLMALACAESRGQSADVEDPECVILRAAEVRAWVAAVNSEGSLSAFHRAIDRPVRRDQPYEWFATELAAYESQLEALESDVESDDEELKLAVSARHLLDCSVHPVLEPMLLQSSEQALERP